MIDIVLRNDLVSNAEINAVDSVYRPQTKSNLNTTSSVYGSIIHKARGIKNFDKQIGGSLNYTRTDHSKRKFCFLPPHLKKRKKRQRQILAHFFLPEKVKKKS